MHPHKSQQIELYGRTYTVDSPVMQGGEVVGYALTYEGGYLIIDKQELIGRMKEYDNYKLHKAMETR
jgi:hypothetical protein